MRLLKALVVKLPMNKEVDWTVETWHLRMALRQAVRLFDPSKKRQPVFFLSFLQVIVTLFALSLVSFPPAFLPSLNL